MVNDRTQDEDREIDMKFSDKICIMEVPRLHLAQIDTFYTPTSPDFGSRSFAGFVRGGETSINPFSRGFGVIDEVSGSGGMGMGVWTEEMTEHATESATTGYRSFPRRTRGVSACLCFMPKTAAGRAFGGED